MRDWTKDIIFILFFCLCYSPVIYIVYKAAYNKPINHWENIDTTQVVGQVQDTCRCTVIDDKMYKVKIKMVQQEIYQLYK